MRKISKRIITFPRNFDIEKVPIIVLIRSCFKISLMSNIEKNFNSILPRLSKDKLVKTNKKRKKISSRKSKQQKKKKKILISLKGK